MAGKAFVNDAERRENADRGNHRSGADAFTPNPDDLRSEERV